MVLACLPGCVEVGMGQTSYLALILYRFEVVYSHSSAVLSLLLINDWINSSLLAWVLVSWTQQVRNIVHIRSMRLQNIESLVAPCRIDISKLAFNWSTSDWVKRIDLKGHAGCNHTLLVRINLCSQVFKCLHLVGGGILVCTQTSQ